MVEEKKTTAKKSSSSAAKVTTLEARVAKLETYIRTFDAFLTNTMISNTVDPSANETLGEMAAAID
jgi:hypothetical protein